MHGFGQAALRPTTLRLCFNSSANLKSGFRCRNTFPLVRLETLAKNFSAEKGKPLGWMVTLTRRRAIDALRKKQAYARAEERFQAQPEQQPLAWVENVTEKDIEAGDTRVLMAKVISSLPEAQQQVIDLAFFQGMSQREIASHTNIPLGTVKTRLELGLKKIYDALKELKDEL